ncbi:antitoxin [Arthrobacter sp. N199823]|uniref:antitoxin n=1 Tax=Arthrobacter sp. N199823 TaxID=2058895 RepID=UPI000CE3DF72|nr:antitoxin [Arthrobacter sp. N199823]
MSIFDDIKGKAEGLINGNEDAIKGGIEKAGDFVDGKTGDKFKDQVDGVQQAASNFIDGAGNK